MSNTYSSPAKAPAQLGSASRSGTGNFQLDDNSIASSSNFSNNLNLTESPKKTSRSSSTPRKTPSKLKSSIRKTPRKLITKLFGGCRVPEEPKIDIVSSTSLEEPGLDSHDSNSTCEDQDPTYLEKLSFKNGVKEASSVSKIISSALETEIVSVNENVNTQNVHVNVTSSEKLKHMPPSDATLSKVQIVQTSPDSNQGIFLPESGSSESEEYNTIPSAHDSAKPDGTTPSQTKSFHPMRDNVSAMGIPTPGTVQSSDANSDQGMSKDRGFAKVLFPQPLPVVSERSLATPMVQRNGKNRAETNENEARTTLEQRLEEDDDSDEDEDAFLPDDFKKFTQEQVQKQIREAQEELKLQHARALEEIQAEFQQELQNHGMQWKEESEAEYERMHSLLKEEKNRADRNHLELLDKTSIVAELQTQLAEAEEALLISKESAPKQGVSSSSTYTEDEVKKLKEELDLLKARYEGHEEQDELRTLQLAKDEANKQISMLQNDLRRLKAETAAPDETTEELIVLRAEKAAQERRIRELEEQVKHATNLERDDSAIVQYSDKIRRLESQLKHLQETSETEIQNLKSIHEEELDSERKISMKKLEVQVNAGQDRFDKLWAEFEDEKAELSTKFKEEIEQLRSETKQLKIRHDMAMERAKAEIKEEEDAKTEALQRQIESLRTQHEMEKSTLAGTASKDQDELKEKVKELQEENERLVDLSTSKATEKLENEIKTLHAEVDSKTSDFEKEKQIISTKAEQESRDLRQQLMALKEEYEERLELVKHDAHIAKSSEVKALRDELHEIKCKNDSQTKDFESKTGEERRKLERYIEDLQTKHEEDLDEARSQASKLESKVAGMEVERKSLFGQIEKLNQQLQTIEASHKLILQEEKNQTKQEMNAEKQTLIRKIEELQSDESTLKQKVQQLEKEAESSRRNYEQKIAEVRSENDKHIDEMLSQLDLVEAEATEQNEKREKMLKEKDAVISALGGQLAEAQARLADGIEQQEKLSSDLASAQERAQESIKEVIKKAETQFETANATYMKLKREYDASQARLISVEKDLKVAKKESELALRKQESREADLQHELAQSKACEFPVVQQRLLVQFGSLHNLFSNTSPNRSLQTQLLHQSKPHLLELLSNTGMK